MVSRPIATLLATFLAAPAPAQTVLSGDLSIDGHLCAGPACSTPESFGNAALKLKSAAPDLLFEDSSTEAGFATNDWRMVINDKQVNGADYFAVEDVGAGRQIFRIEAGAPTNALTVSQNGKVGIGTGLPMNKIHIVDDTFPSIRLENTGVTWGAPASWTMGTAGGSFFLSNNETGLYPFYVAGGYDSSFQMDFDGNISLMGNSQMYAPNAASLFVFRNDGTAKVIIEEDAIHGQSAPRSLLHLINKGRAEITMTSFGRASGEWSLGAGRNLIIKEGGQYSTPSEKTKRLTLYSDTGNLEITGQLVTGGPSCSGGCDAVFSADYSLPSIAEHAANMLALGHLPNIGPTEPGKPVNISEQYGRMLNELEHAHIYIAELEEKMQRIPGLEARLQALEALLLGL